MTVARLRREMSAREFAQWRARDRALATIRAQSRSKGDVLAAVRRRRHGMGG